MADYIAHPLERRDIDLEAVADGIDPDVAATLCLLSRTEQFVPTYHDELAVRSYRDDVELQQFLVGWEAEEIAHGAVIDELIRVGVADHARLAPAEAVAPRNGRAVRAKNRLIATLSPGLFATMHMTIGALNEWLARAAYLTLAELCGNDEAKRHLTNIANQESRHAGFYRTRAAELLAGHAGRQRVVREYLARAWVPAGFDLMTDDQIDFFGRVTVRDPGLERRVARCDELFTRLPGMDGLTPATDYMTHVVH